MSFIRPGQLTFMRKARFISTRLLLILAPLLLFNAGFWAGRVTAPTARAAGEPQAVQSQFSVFWEAWDLAQQKFVNTSALDPRLMTYGAIRGMLESLNDEGHTRFMSPAEAKSEADMLRGHFVGIGIEIALRNKRPVIVAPIHGSPAEKAGLRAGDVIIEVDGLDTGDMTMTELSSHVRGNEGTTVTLSILREGEQQLMKVTVTRHSIEIPSVVTNSFTVQGHRLAHVEITQFSEHVDDELRKAMGPIQSAGLDGAIIDLRNNPGGYRDQAISVTSEFLSKGNVLIEQDRAGKRQEFAVKPGGIATTLPLVVLIDKGSASAAEIMAGAIHDANRASLVGETTFGTGTVLQPFTLRDGSEVLLGVEEWLTPSGKEIWHKGVPPDVAVTLPVGAKLLTPDTEASLTEAQLLNNPDAQFSTALHQLLSTVQR